MKLCLRGSGLCPDDCCELKDLPWEEDLENPAVQCRQRDPVVRWVAAMHASAAQGARCILCTGRFDPCPQCYAAWWQKEHANARPVDVMPADMKQALRLLHVHVAYSVANGSQAVPAREDPLYPGKQSRSNYPKRELERAICNLLARYPYTQVKP